MRVDVTPENQADMDLATELSERTAKFCQKKKGGNRPIGSCSKGGMSVLYWCGDCLKVYAASRIVELWAEIEKTRRRA